MNDERVPANGPAPEPSPPRVSEPAPIVLPAGAVLLDENTDPPLREWYGRLLATATEADFAVGRVRLAGIDMSGVELAGVRHCRMLLGRLDMDTLLDGSGDPHPEDDWRARLKRLRAFVGSGRIRIHSAGMQQWSPDFSVFRGVRAGAGPGGGDRGAAVVLGPHHFARSAPDGAAMTAIIPGENAAALATRRFETMFESGYDVTGVVLELLGQLLAGRAAFPQP
ncbi:MAG TPA: hypothetical protein VNZ57_13130 [Longimicrobiales bacterium]|nr:hypothetical protein [Longimicrobiales bacterium]